MFYTFDPQGSVAQRLASAGTVNSTDAYRAWGAHTSTGSADVFEYGAQWGYYTDAETGLILCTHRYYDPSAGRWITRDPIGYEGGVNLYGYCGNQPVQGIDPSGHFVIIIIIVIIIVVGILAGGCGQDKTSVSPVCQDPEHGDQQNPAPNCPGYTPPNDEPSKGEEGGGGQGGGGGGGGGGD